MGSKDFLAEDILAWRKNLLSKGGNTQDLDWLIDVAGGLGWTALQKLYLYPKSIVRMNISLRELSEIWQIHLHQAKPLQYLVGKCPWRDFELEVTKDVLIPRQETELLVEIAFKKVKYQQKGVWVDLGTGSGAIAIAMARFLTDWQGHATDCSQSALFVAQKNFKRLSPNSKIDFHLGNWWEPIERMDSLIHLAIANPPYIPKAVLEKLEPIVRDNEPHLALCGGKDGLDSLRELVKGAFPCLRAGGWLIFEHHFDQSEKVMNLLLDSGFKDVDYENDLQGIPRFAIGRKP
tara:strand:+ start:722 stop:1594 length:873 start_codon:yes stop_codon:yes gene_type:complete